MSQEMLPEFWLRGPIDGIDAALQPIAHALLQAKEEVNAMLHDFDPKLLWVKPGGLASAAFHLQHIAGVIDRLITYKNKSALSAGQLIYLENEGRFEKDINKDSLLKMFNEGIDKAINEVKHTDITILADYRAVGRKQLPSTVGGLLFHIAEHTMRHTGQLLVTVNILKNWV